MILPTFSRQFISVQPDLCIYYRFTNHVMWSYLSPLLDSIDIRCKSRILKFGNDLDKINSLIGRLMLKSALEENGFAADLNKLQYNEYGKPFFPGVYFSISHSGYLVTLAYSKVCELGIDCEKIVPIDKIGRAHV